ncbi:translation initiation factor IF-3 [Brevundimonas sp. Root1423]|uniref:translation initiation factor IF-3 n=1 Tax=Brevundimonas sp. Root1423 TaxID=1736462 RepID=UPI000700A6FB|nr:translation initiation factor IF-3 [Brevundimonas sp. Root1423]KQY88106.1 translation initiation factor IF-3 [Brevundimonas sp. Root1423]
MNQPPVKDGPPMNQDIRAPRADEPAARQGGKFRFQEQKKKAEARKRQKVVELKEIKLRPNIDVHDYEVKAKAMHRFFDEGDKVKVTLRFRGREMAHPELGMKLLNKVQADFDEIAKVEYAPRMEGRQMIMILAPK